MPEQPEVRHIKSTSLAEYFRVGASSVRQSNRFGTITCLTCRANSCEHITAALPEIERVMMAQAIESATEPGAQRAEDAA